VPKSPLDQWQLFIQNCSVCVTRRLHLKAFVLRLEHCDINPNSTTTAAKKAWFSNVVFVGITSPVQLNSTQNRLYVTILLSSLEYSCFHCETFKRYCFFNEKQLKHNDSPHVTGGVGGSLLWM